MSTLKTREDFIFGELSELPLEPKSENEPRSLFKDFDPDKMIDAYEHQLGIKRNAPALPKVRYKHIMLSPGTSDEDGAILSQLMNDPELYQVINRTQYWTPRGELKLFIEYSENLDLKTERELKKEKEKATNE